MPRKKKSNKFLAAAMEGILPDITQMTKKDKEEYLAAVRQEVFDLLAKYGVEITLDYSIGVKLKAPIVPTEGGLN